MGDAQCRRARRPDVRRAVVPRVRSSSSRKRNDGGTRESLEVSDESFCDCCKCPFPTIFDFINHLPATAEQDSLQCSMANDTMKENSVPVSSSRLPSRAAVSSFSTHYSVLSNHIKIYLCVSMLRSQQYFDQVMFALVFFAAKFAKLLGPGPCRQKKATNRCQQRLRTVGAVNM